MHRQIIGLAIAALLVGGLLLWGGERLAVAEEGVFDHFLYLPLVVKPLPAADLAVSITSAPKPYVAGEVITYTATISNSGPGTSPALTLTQTLPTALLAPSFTPSAGTFDPATGAWMGLVLTAGSRVTLTIAATVEATFSGVLRNTVVITPAGVYDPHPANNQAEDVNPVLAPITDALLNPGFEGPHWWETHYGYQGDMPVPEHWIAWWNMDPSQEFGRPEVVRVIDWTENPVYSGPPARVRSGNRAVTMYRWGKYQGGFYQRVTNLPPGARAEFSVYAHAWTCNEDPPPALSCGDPYAFWFKVGLDPTGGLDPWSPHIVWGEERYIYDAYAQVGPVEAAVGEGGAITVFIFGQGKWPLKHNDAYWDDAALLVTP